MPNKNTPSERNISQLPEFVSARQIIELVGYTHVTLFNHIKAGHLPAGERLGPKKVRWRREVVEAYLSRLKGRRIRRGGADA